MPAAYVFGFVLAGLAVLPSVARAAPADLFYERAVMSAAGDRCNLFSPELSAALGAAAEQARGAALRAGADPRDLDAVRRNAIRRAGSVDCRSADVTVPAARVRAAFAGYQHILRMTYPGSVSMWSADRGMGRTPRWRLSQSADFGANRLIFGLAGKDGPSALVAVADFADDATPYAARIVIRDTGRTQGPYLDGRANQPLSSRLPPRSVTRAVMAEARGAAEPELSPRSAGQKGASPKGASQAWAFRFPTSAIQSLIELDPREALAVEFLFPGDRVKTAYLEVGDFTAGRAFLQMAAR